MLLMLLTVTTGKPHGHLSPLGSLQKMRHHWQRYVQLNFILINFSNCWHRCQCIFFSFILASKLNSSPPGPESQCPSSQKLAPPSTIPICQWESSETGKHSTFQHGISISALSKTHGRSVICSQKHSAFGIRYFPTMLRHLLELENQSSTWYSSYYLVSFYITNIFSDV